MASISVRRETALSANCPGPGRQSALGLSSHTDRQLCLGMQIMNNFICFATSAIHPQTGRPRECFLKTSCVTLQNHRDHSRTASFGISRQAATWSDLWTPYCGKTPHLVQLSNTSQQTRDERSQAFQPLGNQISQQKGGLHHKP